MKPEDVMNALQQEVHRIYGSVLSVQQTLEALGPEESCNDRIQSMRENLAIVHSRLEGLFYLVQECKKSVQEKVGASLEEQDLWLLGRLKHNVSCCMSYPHSPRGGDCCKATPCVSRVVTPAKKG